MTVHTLTANNWPISFSDTFRTFQWWGRVAGYMQQIKFHYLPIILKIKRGATLLQNFCFCSKTQGKKMKPQKSSFDGFSFSKMWFVLAQNFKVWLDFAKCVKGTWRSEFSFHFLWSKTFEIIWWSETFLITFLGVVRTTRFRMTTVFRQRNLENWNLYDCTLR